MDRNLKGTIFIVDIGGYTRFLKDTEDEMNACVIAKLLKAVIKANHLSLLISEIEDDAILFFHHGPAFPESVILRQFEAMLNSFNQEVELLKSQFPLGNERPVKLILHYGYIDNFMVKGFSKLYGPTIIHEHRLVKNTAALPAYALITNEYFKAQHHQIITKTTGIYQLYDMYRLNHAIPHTGTFSKTA